MQVEIKFPQIDPQFDDLMVGCRMVRWLKQPGDRIKEGEDLYELSSEQFSGTTPAQINGILTEIKVSEGQAVTSGVTLALAEVSLQDGLSGGSSIESLYRMNPYDFETVIASLLRAMGLVVTVTKKSSDGGVDIFAESTVPVLGGKFIVQCKRYVGKVPVEMIRDLYGVVMHERASKGILITTGSFSRAGLAFASNKQLELIDGEKLSALLVRHNLVSKP